MKRLFMTAALAIAALAMVQAQQPEMPKLPVDPAVRIGQLENGLTYYIRHNEEPKGQANFYIAQKVGSILEEEEQRGLAHFLEHMCFNGSKHFKAGGIVNYCQSIGVQFGGDLNAYTSIDETVYNIDNVPVAVQPTAIDSCLYILYDWADGLSLNDKDIDDERGVIHEEWRQRRNASIRLYEQLLPKIYPGNRYGQRLPIGLVEVIDNFPYQAIKDYYEKWYRPDQQGIIVVGDIDVDDIEARIRKIFGPIQMPANPAERVYIPIEKNAEPIIALAKDKEMPYAQTYIWMKHDPITPDQKLTLDYLITDVAGDLVSMMMSQRFQEMTQQAEPPFIQAQMDDEDFFLSKTEGALTGLVVSSENDYVKAVTTLYREMLRAVRGGFTASEFERAKAELMTYVESAYNQREKKKSYDFCQEYVQNFINGEPIMGIENEYALLQQLAPQIPVEVINAYMQELVSDTCLVVASMLPDKEGVTYPSEQELKEILAAVAAEDIEPYVDSVSDEPLISELPQPGKVVKTSDSKFGYRLYQLSNGVKVYMKSTDFNKDQIMMNAFSWGGTSLYDESEALNLKNMGLYTVGGVGSFNVTDLNKVLAGKKASVSPRISMLSEGMNGSTTPKDFETMMQLTYLYFTSPRSDAEAFQSWQTRQKAVLQNAESQPNTALQDSLYFLLYDNNPRNTQMKAADVDNVDYERIMQIGRERFANASDFDFIFTGAIDEEVFVPLIEQYLGSLPVTGAKAEKYRNVSDFGQGVRNLSFDRKMEQEMATVVFFWNGKSKYSLKDILANDIAGQVLDIVYTEEIREKEGGTYGVSVVPGTQNEPSKKSYVQIVYQTDPARALDLNEKIIDILDEFAVTGPSDENMSKIKEYMVKNYNENLRENSFYQSVMREWLTTGVDQLTDWEKTLNKVTAKDVAKSVKKILKQKNSMTLIMNGYTE
ncbi:MAG: insulinase family protein [Bacteroidaceae bacterium]|nr:insulinase family protein [Bacteroidaceae bacterium]